MADEKSVAEQVQEHLDRWNPRPVDHTLERVVGVPTDEGDTRATSHVPMEELNLGFQDALDDNDGDLPEVPTDEDGNPDYDSMKNEDLKQHLRARDLPVSGNHDDLVERLEADDEEE